MEILERIKRRPDISVSDEVLKDYIQIISDRLCLRLGVGDLPQTFHSICVAHITREYRAREQQISALLL